MRLLRLICSVVLCAVIGPSLALEPLSATGPLTARHFARFPAYQAVEISPDGRYLAVSARLEGQAALLFFELPSKKIAYGTRFGNDIVAGDINWVSNKRLLVSLAVQEGDADAPLMTGELLAINADGGDARYLFGSAGQNSTGMRLANGPISEDGAAFLESALPDEPDFALVRVLKHVVLTAAGEYYQENFSPLSRIDLQTGRRREVARAPVRTVQHYFADTHGQAFLVSGVGDDSYQLKSFWRPGEGEWQPVPIKTLTLTPLKLSGDGGRAYFHAEYDDGRQCLLEWPLPATATATTLPREVVCGAGEFFGEVYFTAADRPYGYEGVDGKGVVLLDTQPIEAQALASLQAHFKGQYVVPVGATRQHEKLLYRVSSDRNSGEYYIFDAALQEASYFDAAQTWLDPERMASMQRIRYKARDGLDIEGYLTLPTDKPAKKLPLVVLPHGGPIGVSDSWGWDAKAQFLASRGYAVLQMNYRGSGGYGEAFEKKGFGEWGGKMIDDISDGARWAVDQGVADAQRLCIFGVSYGGYAALMSAVREPDLYRCAIGYAGAYDMNLLYSESVYSKKASSRLFWQDTIGKTAEERKLQSPITYIDRLKAAVMIVHGEEDIITPLSQAKALRNALDAHKKPYEWLVKSREGHGFFNEDNRVELYDKLAAFLEKNIGK